VRRPVFIGDFSALVRRQRILDEESLAEGEELDSNILSQEFAPVRRPWWGGGNHNEKAAKYLKNSPKRRSRESALGEIRQDRMTRF
jgi:hypothetical protein